MKREYDIEKINRNNFRSSLEALARPGKEQIIQPLFGSGLLAMASVFLYAEVTYYYQGELDFELIRALCGSQQTMPDEADYLFFDAPLTQCLEPVKTGTPESPELSATLLFSYTDEHLSEGVDVVISGPGINRFRQLTLPTSIQFLRKLQEKNEVFPMGIDIYFISPHNEILGLPRTTHMEFIA
jgi:alpha-D-ribose 1-methylphosphonate 5-triphosphate synthase subunit PhnH